MGVDAVVCVAIPEAEATEAKVRRLSYELHGAFHGNGMLRLRPWESDHYTLDPAPSGVVLFDLWQGWRHYGEGYERGPLESMVAVFDWLKAKVPGLTIYYGTDHGDVLEEWTQEVRDRLWAHFVAVGHLPYYSGNNWREHPVPECPDCREPMLACGGGPTYSFWNCYGCTKRATTFDDGQVRMLSPGEPWT